MSSTTRMTDENPGGPAMSFSEALELIHELASGNQIEAIDIAFGDPGLASQRAWQQAALDTLHDLVVNHEEAIDALDHPAMTTDWPDTVWRADRGMNPDDPIDAVRICMDLAEGAVLEEDQTESPELDAERRRQLLALDATRDLLGHHAETLRRSITIIPG